MKSKLTAIALGLLPVLSIAGTPLPIYKIDQCRTITSHFFENGVYHAGDTESYSQTGLTLADQKNVAYDQATAQGNGFSMTINERNDCEIQVRYALHKADKSELIAQQIEAKFAAMKNGGAK